jgi:hypothetical protein
MAIEEVSRYITDCYVRKVKFNNLFYGDIWLGR